MLMILQYDTFPQSLSLSLIKPLYLVTRPFKNKQVNDSCQLHLGLSITDFATKRLINVKPPLLFFIHDYETILSLISH